MIKKPLYTLIIITILSGLFYSCKQDLPYACIEMSTDVLYVDSVIQFESCSLGTDNYLWNFGDGNISTESDPEHSYLSTGQYEVSLYVESTRESDIVYHTIIVYTPEE